jgi:cysteine desulfurase / selenocysteine lyase
MSVVAPRRRSVGEIRADFPLLDVKVNGRQIVYLDNAATSQKPRSVLKAIDRYWETENANVHRGVHHLSQVATAAYENARDKVRLLINAAHREEVIFTKGCTESINLVAEGLSSSLGSRATYGRSDAVLGTGDVILVSTAEHHSNLVPWQLAAERAGGKVIPIPVDDDGVIDQEAYERLLGSEKVKIVAVAHVSNALGNINPIRRMIATAHAAGALVLIDGAQAGPHLRIDVQDLDADFYTLSCHKIYAPTGIGVLYGKRRLLEALPAYQGGGDMIHTVSFERGTTYAPLPAKLEAGTPNMAGAVGLGAAVDYLCDLSELNQHSGDALAEAFTIIQRQEQDVTHYAAALIEDIPGLRIVGSKEARSSILSFVVDGVHPHDLGTILDNHGVAVRTGHHCCMPLMHRLGLPATARASFAFYNTREEAERLAEAIRAAKEMFAV